MIYNKLAILNYIPESSKEQPSVFGRVYPVNFLFWACHLKWCIRTTIPVHKMYLFIITGISPSLFYYLLYPVSMLYPVWCVGIHCIYLFHQIIPSIYKRTLIGPKRTKGR